METQETTPQETIKTNIELDKESWYTAKKKAKAMGTNASTILRILLNLWVNDKIDIVRTDLPPK